MSRKWRVVKEIHDADVVSICSAHYQHLPQIYEAMNVGCAVICEKPIADSLSSVDNLIRDADERNIPIYPVFQYRYAEHTGFEDVMMLSFRRDRNYWQGWRINWDQSFGGALSMHGIHALDLVAAAVGMPDALKCQLSGPSGLPVETRAMIEMQWSGGQRFTIAVAADWELGEGELINPWSDDASPAAYMKMFEAIHDDITDGPGRKLIKGMFGVRVDHEEDERLATLNDARNAIELLTMCYKSHIYGMYVQRISEDDVFYHGWTNLAKQWYGIPEPILPIIN